MQRLPRNIFLLGVCLSVGVLQADALFSSKDAFVRREGASWSFGTSSVEKRVALKQGRLVLTSFQNKRSRHDYREGGSDSFEMRFSVDGHEVGSEPQEWKLVSDNTQRLRQGELQLDIKLQGPALHVTKHYVIYPGTSLIREWLSIQNEAGKPVRISHLHFLNSRVLGNSAEQLQLHYLTGGGNFNGSQLLKTENISRTYKRTFDSYTGIQKGSYSGYLPLLVLRNPGSGDGVAVGWDYMGHWISRLGDEESGSFGIALEAAGYEKELQPQAAIETPKAFLASFSGDLDELGNQLLDWQYEYLWDFTNPDYFAKTRWAVDWPPPWVGNGGTPSADNWGRRLSLDLRYVDLLREAGGDILWDDAGWYDSWGNWNGPDWSRTTAYLRKHDMRWVLWYPTFLATPESRVAQNHPDWLIREQQAFEQSIPATADWQKRLLDKNASEWGDFQWRYDIAPAVSANDTDALEADQNFRSLLQLFKTAHPKSGIDACDGGGRWISYDLARLAESGEYTDGGVGPYSGYYTSLFVPPDKIHNVSDFDHTYYVPASDHVHLGMNPTWYRDPGDGPDVEAIRKDWDLFHYMVAQGVAGRWSHVFRPRVENDDPIWYFQRMDRTGSKGIIITKHAKSGPDYFLVSKPLDGTDHDQYRGGTADMSGVLTTDDAALGTGIYEDPVDGDYRYYGVPGEVYGPLNFRYQAESGEKSFVTSMSRPGASQRVGNRFFGMAFQTGSEALTITQLGQFAPDGNRGRYRLTLVCAKDKAVLGSAILDMNRTEVDRLGFKYVKLPQPIRLQPDSGKPVVIFPRGLSPSVMYDVRAYRSSLRLRKSGSELMANGISLPTVPAGELIWLNLPRYPGSGTDKTSPTPPAHVTKRFANNLGAAGIEVAWSPGSDNNWISYYEILKNGAVVAKAAKGRFYFDHSPGARDELAARYEVRTVDGDGNRSPATPAEATSGDPETYEALGDFGPVQGGRHWRYEETIEDGVYRDLVWDNGGYEGRWSGSGLGRVGRIWMQPSAAADLSRTFVVSSGGTLTLNGRIEKDPSAESDSPVFVRITHNARQIWPDTGWAAVPSFESPIQYRIRSIRAAPGDAIRFIVKRNDHNRANPIIWNPVIVMEKGS